MTVYNPELLSMVREQQKEILEARECQGMCELGVECLLSRRGPGGKMRQVGRAGEGVKETSMSSSPEKEEV